MCVRQHAPARPRFFPFEGESGCWILAVPSFVPMKFSLCLHQICKFSICSSSFQCVAQLVPQQLSLYVISYALSITLVTYIQRSPKDEITTYHICFRDLQILILKICAQLNKEVDQCVFFGRNIARFRPEKYNFDLCKGFCTEQWPKFARFPKKKGSRSLDFYDKFHQVAMNKEGSCFFFLLSYLGCNRIWLNHLRDDGHFSYITKLQKKTP